MQRILGAQKVKGGSGDVFPNEQLHGTFEDEFEMAADASGEFLFWVGYDFTFPADPPYYTCLFLVPQMHNGTEFVDIARDADIRVPVDFFRFKIRRRWIR